MKFLKLLPTVALLMSLLTLASPVFSQRLSAIDKVQYDLVRDRAFERAGKVLRRAVTETSNYVDQKVDSVETLLRESFPNGDERWSGKTKKAGVTVDSFDLVYLGKYEYRKEGQAAWTKRCVKNCSTSESSGSMKLGGGSEPAKVEEFLMGQTTLADQPAPCMSSIVSIKWERR